MTPKHHALLSSLAASKDGGVDMARARLATLDDLEAGRITHEAAVHLLREGYLSLGQIICMMYDTAAVLAEPMHMAEVPASVAEPAPQADTKADTKADEPASSEPEQSSTDPGPGLYTTRRKGDRTAV